MPTVWRGRNVYLRKLCLSQTGRGATSGFLHVPLIGLCLCKVQVILHRRRLSFQVAVFNHRGPQDLGSVRELKMRCASHFHPRAYVPLGMVANHHRHHYESFGMHLTCDSCRR